jgi:hypothetical protein
MQKTNFKIIVVCYTEAFYDPHVYVIILSGGETGVQFQAEGYSDRYWDRSGFYPVGTGDLSLTVNWKGRESEYSLPSNAEIENAEAILSQPRKYSCWYDTFLIKHKENFASRYLITDRDNFISIFHACDELLHFIRADHFFISLIVVSTFGECSLPEICIAPCLCCSFSD